MMKEEKINKKIKYLRNQLNRSAKHKHLRKEEKEGHIVKMLDELEILEGMLDIAKGNYYTREEIFGEK